MTTPDVPAERERDEHVERVTNALEEAMAQHGLAFEPVDDAAEVGATLAALLARQEAPAEGISLSAQLSQAAAWMRVWDECQRLGMDTYGAPSTRTGLDIVLDFIRGHAAPQEAREPDGWTDSASADALRTGRVGGIAAVRSSAGMQGPVPVYLGAPAPAEATEASDALRSAIEAMGDLHRALLHMGRGRLRAAEATEPREPLPDFLRCMAKRENHGVMRQCVKGYQHEGDHEAAGSGGMIRWPAEATERSGS